MNTDNFEQDRMAENAGDSGADKRVIDKAAITEMTTEQLVNSLESELAEASVQREELEIKEQNILLLMDTLKNQGKCLDDILPV